MDSTQRRLSSAAWSMLEALSGFRKSVHKELDFINSVSSDLPSDKLEDAILETEFLASEIANFLSELNNMDSEESEKKYAVLSASFDNLKALINVLVGK
ncbi:MAG: hypothetical protein R2788_08915 [Saprospiraceae bacterium]